LHPATGSFTLGADLQLLQVVIPEAELARLSGIHEHRAAVNKAPNEAAAPEHQVFMGSGLAARAASQDDKR
jgi:hypothetical protein